jgi:prephenate dehydratase
MSEKINSQLYFQKNCTVEEFLASEKEQTVIGIHGIKGCFTDEALARLAQENLALDPVTYSVKELVHAHTVLEEVAAGKIDRGIFAVANSGSGAYLASVEAMGQYQYQVIALFTMPINMCLLSRPEISQPEELSEFRGHPVAIAQCRKTLSKRWPNIPTHPDTDEMDTALSAQLLSEGKLSKTAGIFASKRAAELYNLRVLVESVHDDPNNATAFVLIKKTP